MIEYTLLVDGMLAIVVDCTCNLCGHTWTERVPHDATMDYRDDSGAMIDLDGLMDLRDIQCPREDDCQDT